MNPDAGSFTDTPAGEKTGGEVLSVAWERARVAGFFTPYELETDGAACGAAEDFFRIPIEEGAGEECGDVTYSLEKLPVLSRIAKSYAELLFCKILLALEQLEVGPRARTCAVADLADILTAARSGRVPEMSLGTTLDFFPFMP